MTTKPLTAAELSWIRERIVDGHFLEMDVPRLLATVDHYREREDRLIDLIAELRDPKGNGRIGAAYAANRIDEILSQTEKVSQK